VKTKDVTGVVLGAAVSIVGLAFAPRPYHAWGGICSWETVFPNTSLWVHPSVVMFDGCDNGLAYLVMLIVYLSFVFLVAGALSSRIAERPSRSRGALINAVVMASALLALAIQARDDFSLFPTVVLGVSAVGAAAALAFVGGPRAKPRG